MVSSHPTVQLIYATKEQYEEQDRSKPNPTPVHTFHLSASTSRAALLHTEQTCCESFVVSGSSSAHSKTQQEYLDQNEGILCLRTLAAKKNMGCASSYGTGHWALKHSSSARMDLFKRFSWHPASYTRSLLSILFFSSHLP